MYFCLYFVLGLLSSTGCFSANLNPQKVVAFAGENAILPCSLTNSGSDDLPTVEWSKEGLKPNVVFLYRNGFETFEMKNLAFEFRTSLFMREVKNGNVSLRISNVKPSDAGIYQCLIIQRNGSREATDVQLVVALVSDPRLSVDSDQNQRVTVACEATCWLPAPLMEIVDEKGKNITDTVEIRRADPTECYTVRQTAIVQSHTIRIVCRVKQPQTNQSRTAEILLSAQWMRSRPFKLAVFSVEVIAVVCFLGLCVCGVWSACSKYAEWKQQTQGISLDHELTGVACEGTLLLNPPSETNEVDNTANRIIENMKKELADLKLENSKKDQAILKLLVKIQSMPAAPKNNQPGNSPEFSLDYPQFFRSSDHNLENREVFVTKQDSSKLLISQSQSGNLGLGHTKHKVVRNHSCPAVWTSAPVVRRDEETVSPPQMVLCTDARPKARLLQRKHSLGFLPSFRSRNIYFPLPRLSEQ
ncbi:butyrophilin subfamily 1 member A1-like [Xiphophorus hellerii]|uniref:butyrophilin subfamily 1 member A1-like n=1 Tax=Xiphophorus hellerii TaxID=8084 RepID=UPI0013B36A38|nr:butyrophilin subfamily 1 member A1-like [Xiphophorus hellerii]